MRTKIRAGWVFTRQQGRNDEGDTYKSIHLPLCKMKLKRPPEGVHHKSCYHTLLRKLSDFGTGVLAPGMFDGVAWPHAH